jgi:hypothetical protein
MAVWITAEDMIEQKAYTLICEIYRPVVKQHPVIEKAPGRYI